MKPSHQYYKKILYPLQDKVLRVLSDTDNSFYLTGGTALSRVYLQHRYSDDLDFFLNQADDFVLQAERCIQVLQTSFHDQIEISLTTDSFVRLFLNDSDVSLKIEFVNDVSYRHGTPLESALFVRTDTIRNILSNKIGALERGEARDLADIIEIALHFQFNWKEVIAEAKLKDMWVDESEIMAIIKSFPLEKMAEIKWIKSFDAAMTEKSLSLMLFDIFYGKDNSLFSAKP